MYEKDRLQGEGASISQLAASDIEAESKIRIFRRLLQWRMLLGWLSGGWILAGTMWSQDPQGHRKTKGAWVWQSSQALEQGGQLQSVSPGMGSQLRAAINREPQHKWATTLQAGAQQTAEPARLSFLPTGRLAQEPPQVLQGLRLKTGLCAWDKSAQSQTGRARSAARDLEDRSDGLLFSEGTVRSGDLSSLLQG